MEPTISQNANSETWLLKEPYPMDQILTKAWKILQLLGALCKHSKETKTNLLSQLSKRTCKPAYRKNTTNIFTPLTTIHSCLDTPERFRKIDLSLTSYIDEYCFI